MMVWTKAVFFAALAASTLSAGTAAASGGDDHTHGDEARAASNLAAPRLVAVSETLELVGVLTTRGLSLYLDRPDTTEPVTDASIVADVDGKSVPVATNEDGTYTLEGDWAARGGSHDFVFTVTAGDSVDLLSGTLEVPDQHSAHAQVPRWLWGLGAVLAAAALFAGWVRLRQRRGPGPGAAIFMIAAFFLSVPTPGLAGGGDDHTHAEEAVATPRAYTLDVPDSPYRLPGGSLFVPKATQRLIELRTTVASTTREQQSVRLLGRLIPDPARAGLVQSAAGGRIAVPTAGLPTLGGTVQRGQVLAYVEPALSGGDRAALAGERTRAATDLALAEQRLARLERLHGTVAGREIDAARLEAEGLRRRLSEIDSASSHREILRAPIDGRIARMNVAAGQVVRPDDVLFEVVADGAFVVEASNFSAASTGTRAFATLPDGRVLSLRLAGQGAAYDDQAIHLRFSVDDAPAGVPLYTPVKVLVSLDAASEGIAVPARAVVQSTAGTPVVWVKVAPETFEPRSVRYEELDGERVLVVAGLKSPARVVVSGAGLINQIR